jgi:hypothetical protein
MTDPDPSLPPSVEHPAYCEIDRHELLTIKIIPLTQGQYSPKLPRYAQTSEGFPFAVGVWHRGSAHGRH